MNPEMFLNSEGKFIQQRGMDVAVYTQSKKGRHWLGRVSEIDQKKGKFKLQWGSRGDLEEMNEGY